MNNMIKQIYDLNKIQHLYFYIFWKFTVIPCSLEMIRMLSESSWLKLLILMLFMFFRKDNKYVW